MLRWVQLTGGVRCCLGDFVTSSPAPIYETDEPIIACPIAPMQIQQDEAASKAAKYKKLLEQCPQ